MQKGLGGVSTTSSLVFKEFIPVIGSTLTSAGILYWNYGPQFGGCLVVAVGVAAVYNARAAKTIVDLRALSIDACNKSFNDVMTAINHPLTIQSFLKEEFEQKRIKQSLQAYTDSETKSAEFSNQMARRI